MASRQPTDGEKEKGTGGVQFRLYVTPTNNLEGDLLYQGFLGSANRPALANALLQRGWMHLLHSTTPSERAILIRSLGLPDEVIAEIDRLPAPMLYQGPGTLQEPTRESPMPAAHSAAVPASAPAIVNAPAPLAAPTALQAPPAQEPAPAGPVPERIASATPPSRPIEARVISVPRDSFMGGGGLL